MLEAGLRRSNFLNLSFLNLSRILSVDRQESMAEDIVRHSNSQCLPIVAGRPEMYSAKDAGAFDLIESC